MDLGLSIRTIAMLKRAGIDSGEALLMANLWKLHAAGAGKVVLQEVAAVQAKLQGLEPLVPPEVIEREVSAREVTADEVTKLAERLAGAGWSEVAPGR